MKFSIIHSSSLPISKHIVDYLPKLSAKILFTEKYAYWSFFEIFKQRPHVKVLKFFNSVTWNIDCLSYLMVKFSRKLCLK